MSARSFFRQNYLFELRPQPGHDSWFLSCKYCDEWLIFNSEAEAIEHKEQCAKIVDGEIKEVVAGLLAAEAE